MIRAAVGVSTRLSSREAALEAAGIAVGGLAGYRAACCIAFVTSEHDDGAADLLATLSEATGTPYVVGCSGAGVIAPGIEIEDGPALGVLAIASDRLRATPFMFHDEGDLGLTAGKRVGERLVSSRGSSDLVVVWPDPLHVRPDRLLQGIDSALDGVPVVGAAAAGEGPEEPTFQFCGSASAHGAVAGVRLGGTFRHRVAVTQGCRPLGKPLQVTRSHGSLILEVDGRPALEVLREAAPEGILERKATAFQYLFVGLLPDPLDAPPTSGEYLVRNILTADEDTGVLGISEEVEEGQAILFALREGTAARSDLSRVLERVVATGDAGRFRFGLYFDCLARGRSLYGESSVDAALLEAALPGLPFLGFHCNAEIAPFRGVNHLFTYTGVLVLIGE